ncbi:hypothetical protein [Nocardioides sp. LHG3406-4]|uniref:hypothetical protein n=1 Tax=Nocardioides sp. LHG3406-4 TaxID=2804575 RepID=UPI003CF0BD18
MVDPAAGQLVGAFLTGLLLIVPLRAALATTTYGALYGWLTAAAVMVLLFGLLLRLAGVPRARGLALATSAAFAVTALVALTAVALIGDPGGHTSVCLLAGIPAAAFAAPAAVAVVRWAEDDTGATALGVVACVVGLFLAATAGPSVGELVDDARHRADQTRKLEAAGLTPYLPEIDGTRAEFIGTTSVRPNGGESQMTGYSLRYEPESTTDQDYDAPHLDVEIGVATGPACEPIEGYLECREGDGYVVTERDGVPEQVSHDGTMRLSAMFRDDTGDLPDADEVGRALADAEQSEWDEVLDPAS